MKYQEVMARLAQYHLQIAEIRKKARELQANVEPQEVTDYRLASLDGPVLLSSLFGRQETLIVIHNMGAGCRYCTLWADGFNGIYEHLRSRAAFVVVSPDRPEKQMEFAAERGWKFPMVSYEGNRFGQDMGYVTEKGPMPGISIFTRKAGKVMRVSNTTFSPRDDFCTAWHIFDLIPEGSAGWQPQYHYDANK